MVDLDHIFSKWESHENRKHSSPAFQIPCIQYLKGLEYGNHPNEKELSALLNYQRRQPNRCPRNYTRGFGVAGDELKSVAFEWLVKSLVSSDL